MLKSEMVIAMGCTEPAAAALAGCKACQLLGREPEKLTVYASRDMIKNAMSVGIPNCSERGILTAVCLGAYSSGKHMDLSILSDVSREQRTKASALTGLAHLVMAENVPPVYVRVAAEDGHSASCTVSGAHDRFTELTSDGEVLLQEEESRGEKTDVLSQVEESLTLESVLDFARQVPAEQIEFVYDSAEINYRLARHSIEQGYGLHIGNTVLEDLPEKPGNLHEARTFAAAYAAAGSDARMSGCSQAVVINSGSGNQGITCTVPILVLGDYLKSPKEKILRALCISELVGLMITARKDRLSALCGAFTAAMGAGCGMVFLMDGGIDEMNRMICNMVGNLSGMVCDGAKTSCALKIYSSVEAACLAVRLAFHGYAPGRESGIIGADASESIENLMDVSHHGMVDTDRVILSIMLRKQL